MDCLRFGSSTRKYSANIRRFCFTLHFYSSGAYEYVRKTFSDHLPAARTLRCWYSTLDCSSGFTAETFDALKQRAEWNEKNGKKLLVGLVLDAMFTRKHSQWDRAGKKFLGHNMVRDQATVCLPLASHALTLMVCGIEEEFKATIAYFLNNGSTSDEISNIIDTAMFKLKEAGCTVVSFTFDGAKENIATGKKLGATFENPFILNPHDPHNKVYLLLDPAHMIKLIRNCLANKRILYDGNDEEIRWEFIEHLVDLQINQSVNLCNKLSKTHIQFEDKKMNVRIAAQTISKSTSNSIKYADEHLKNPKFAKSAPTSEYLLMFNNLFDVMNSKRGHCNNEYKRPFSTRTEGYFDDLFDKAKLYIESLKVKEGNRKVPVLKSRSFTPFLGFLQNILSFKGIFKDYGLDEFYTFSVSQDHLESFFGCVRRMNGCNDNPTEQQFAAAYKKLLFQNEITTSSHGNCQNDVTKILFVSSEKTIKEKPNIHQDLMKLIDFDIESPVEESFESSIATLPSIQKHFRAYMASIAELNVIQKIVRSGKKKCLKCINIFIENEITDDEFISFKSENSDLHQPCKSTVDIIHDVERLLKNYGVLEETFEASVTHILSQIDISQLYTHSEFGEDHETNHKSTLIRLVVETYLDKRSTDASKIISRLCQSELVRHKKLKDTHRAGQ